MDERIKFLTIELSKKLNHTVINFLNENLNLEEQACDVLDLVSSGTLTTFFNMMSWVSSGNEEAEERVHNIIYDFKKMMSKYANCETEKLVSYARN